jgi:hypothetical protein
MDIPCRLLFYIMPYPLGLFYPAIFANIPQSVYKYVCWTGTSELLYERPEVQWVGCNTRASNHQVITYLCISAYMAGNKWLCSPVQAVSSNPAPTGGYQYFT